jgi:hypothetical protein
MLGSRFLEQGRGVEVRLRNLGLPADIVITIQARSRLSRDRVLCMCMQDLLIRPEDRTINVALDAYMMTKRPL